MLTLPIKKKWFDMILSGEKKEEYREITPYYTSRFPSTFNTFDVLFRNGYSKSSPAFVAKVKLSIGKGRPEWGAEENQAYYILNIIEIKRSED